MAKAQEQALKAEDYAAVLSRQAGWETDIVSAEEKVSRAERGVESLKTLDSALKELHSDLAGLVMALEPGAMRTSGRPTMEEMEKWSGGSLELRKWRVHEEAYRAAGAVTAAVESGVLSKEAGVEWVAALQQADEKMWAAPPADVLERASVQPVTELKRATFDQFFEMLKGRDPDPAWAAKVDGWKGGTEKVATVALLSGLAVAAWEVPVMTAGMLGTGIALEHLFIAKGANREQAQALSFVATLPMAGVFMESGTLQAGKEALSNRAARWLKGQWESLFIAEGAPFGRLLGERGFIRIPPHSQGVSASRSGPEVTGVKQQIVTGQIVLGHYPEYVNLSDQLNAKRFNIPGNVWKKMSDVDRWAANQKFLDRAILRGNEIVLATSIDKVKPGSYFERELNYIFDRGYKISQDGKRLVRQ